jgi:uncharacterized RDD family membrane protein YckC
VTTPPQFPAEQPAAAPANLADWATRAIGYLIDIAPGVILGIIFGWGVRNLFLNGFFGLVGIAYTAYLGYLDGLTGQTPGKAVMGTRVVNAQGQLIGSGMGIGRKFAHIIDSIVCGLGYLLPLVDSKRQTIADKVVNTYVVVGQEKKPFSLNLWLPPSSQPAAPPQAPPPAAVQPQTPPPPPPAVEPPAPAPEPPAQMPPADTPEPPETPGT